MPTARLAIGRSTRTWTRRVPGYFLRAADLYHRVVSQDGAVHVRDRYCVAHLDLFAPHLVGQGDDGMLRVLVQSTRVMESPGQTAAQLAQPVQLSMSVRYGSPVIASFSVRMECCGQTDVHGLQGTSW